MHHLRGYHYSGTHVDLNQGHAGSRRSTTQSNQATIPQASPSGFVDNQVNATQVEVGTVAQGQRGQTQLEPHVPETFKEQKPRKARVDEGNAVEKEKPFCFRCYKPGHGKLECFAKLLCDICGSREHLTGKCHILK
jgi:hypothetical protein